MGYDKEKHREYMRNWSRDRKVELNEKLREKRKLFPQRYAAYRKKAKDKYPWLKTLRRIRSRCHDKTHKSYPWYGAKGIKCLLKTADVKFLWERDNAAQFVKPSIDRIDTNGHYSLENCRYIELKENVAISHVARRNKKY